MVNKRLIRLMFPHPEKGEPIPGTAGSAPGVGPGRGCGDGPSLKAASAGVWHPCAGGKRMQFRHLANALSGIAGSTATG